MQSQKGFTIIELIVVIAIIAVLASIVLINVTGYINKGKDAAIKGNMGSALVNAAAYFDTNGKYDAVLGTPGAAVGFCGDIKYTVPAAAITSAGGTVVQYCNDTTFCSCTTLKTSANTYCVDSAGYKKETAAACAARCAAGQQTCID